VLRLIIRRCLQEAASLQSPVYCHDETMYIMQDQAVFPDLGDAKMYV
jgi:hypothetical protein